jgi:hypothetical protein
LEVKRFVFFRRCISVVSGTADSRLRLWFEVSKQFLKSGDNQWTKGFFAEHPASNVPISC